MTPLLEGGRSGLVVLPTLAEAQSMAELLRQKLGGAVLLAASALEAKRVTAAWVEAATIPGRILVGTREVCFWPVAGLGQAIIVGEGRRGMKERQTPTVHARELLRRRGAVERFGMLFAGPLPTTEAIASGVEITRSAVRAWPLVEVADRTEDPPGGGPLAVQTRAAVAATVKRGGRVFVFTRSRSFAPAFRCVACRSLRDCPTCGAAAARSDRCPRCDAELGDCRHCGGDRFEPLGAGIGRIVEEVARLVGTEAVGEVGSGRAVEVGTERDLPAVAPVHLAVVSDADGLILAPSYRAEEEAVRLMARVALTVGPGRGRRCLVQTSRPAHPVIVTLRRGDPTEFLEAELARRVNSGFPPAGELLAVETRDEPLDATNQLRGLAGSHADVLGPADTDGGTRWLVQGRDLRPVRVGLRRLVQDWRDAGTRVRIDADPIDL
jgi:primosomal protein N'